MYELAIILLVGGFILAFSGFIGIMSCMGGHRYSLHFIGIGIGMLIFGEYLLLSGVA